MLYFCHLVKLIVKVKEVYNYEIKGVPLSVSPNHNYIHYLIWTNIFKFISNPASKLNLIYKNTQNLNFFSQMESEPIKLKCFFFYSQILQVCLLIRR